jgi:HAD superfamily hydrolase (TIGR01509 family)
MTSRRKTPRNIKLAIFDLDGTLVDAFPAIADSINHMLKEMGYPAVSLRTVKRSVGWGVDSLVDSFVPEHKRVEALVIFRKHHDVRLRHKLKLLPGTKTLLPFLKAQGCLLAIASNRPSQFCHIILKELKIDGYFDHVICGDMVKHPKPAPDMVKAILRATRVSAGQAIYAGDMTVDLACGRSAGVFTLGVPTGSCTRAELMAAKPGRFIERISQVRELFR